ncbi:MAG: GtrA family protein [Coriobacteriales bacterium]|nr:GtrA family protein [Coriobacteriales bacterium]
MQVMLSRDTLRDMALYVVFGACTTLANIAAYWVSAHVLGIGVMASTVVAWVLAVLFAYLTNRRWVFHSEARGTAGLAREAVAFYGCRLATGCRGLGDDVRARGSHGVRRRGGQGCGERGGSCKTVVCLPA